MRATVCLGAHPRGERKSLPLAPPLRGAKEPALAPLLRGVKMSTLVPAPAGGGDMIAKKTPSKKERGYFQKVYQMSTKKAGKALGRKGLETGVQKWSTKCLPGVLFR